MNSWRQYFRTLCGLPQELWSSLHWAVQVDPPSQISVKFLQSTSLPPKTRPFRFRDNTASFNASSKRYVITNPPGNKSLLLELIQNVIFYYTPLCPPRHIQAVGHRPGNDGCHQTKAHQLSRTNAQNFSLTESTLPSINPKTLAIVSN